MRKDCLYEEIDRVIVRIAKTVSFGAGICLAAIMLLAFFDTLFTKLFHTSIKNATELVTYLNVPVVFLAAAYVELDRGHTRIDLLVNKFPQLLRTILRAAGSAVGVAVCAYTGWVTVQVALGKLQNHTRATPGQAGSIFIWPFCAILALGYVLMAVVFIWSIVRDIRGFRLKSPDMPESKEVCE